MDFNEKLRLEIIKHLEYFISDPIKRVAEDVYFTEDAKPGYISELLEELTFSAKRASEAVAYLGEHELKTYADVKVFEKKFGGTPDIDLPLEYLLDVGWQNKSGLIEV
ncbi:hypothetical protein M2137_001253 [Parabacteroides sp. PFB2-10]|uniref:hypothetical protein n=1 Tax=Parabacteroides sp. PFB2-10 TaxID=1742405 RepID=UPI0024730975|nr:hypothetical protein [Parabacteroides sp. PFB2-10]MDH6312482.1 hypothetical protein [Parabacteroides sp. PFB2-10]